MEKRKERIEALLYTKAMLISSDAKKREDWSGVRICASANSIKNYFIVLVSSHRQFVSDLRRETKNNVILCDVGFKHI